MTGYGSGDGSPGRGTGEPGEGGHAERPEAGRPGPLPPRFEPHRPAAPGYPAVPGQPAPFAPAPAAQPGVPAAGFPPPAVPPAAGFPPPATGPGSAGQPGTPDQSAVPAPRTTWSPPPTGSQWGGSTATVPDSPTPGGPAWAGTGPGGWPASGQAAGTPLPGGPAPQPAAGPGHSGVPVGQPVSGAAYPPGQPGWPAPVTAGPAAPARRRWLPVAALALAAVLAVVAGVQAYQLNRLDDRLATTDRRLAEAQSADDTRLGGLEKRAEALEKQAGAAFNPEAVASAVLPSVFRVRAGQFTGTAFAIGKPLAGGGTTLLTNFHVVESVWDGGGRKVFLERTDQRFDATIVKVDEAKDLAQLRTTAKFTGLVAARTPVKSGQQIVVVGAPLGLQDSVTTGVVSAFRKDEDGSGPVIQFDAPINPGNSGGPVINGAKEVVGIATAKARDAEGIGLAVPVKTACDTFKIC